MSGLSVSRLFLYPVKSAAGIALESADLDDFGPRFDRRWMVVDPEGRFMSQRSFPRMALVRPELTGDSLVLTAQGMDRLELAQRPASTPEMEVTIWKSRTLARSMGPDAAGWLSEFLGTPARLVYMPEDPGEGKRRFHAGSRISFADAYPFLLISEESLEELNRRLPSPLPMDRFRPNLVVRGGSAHAEDGWRRVRIGATEFRLAKPCARCAVTTVDQSSGVRGKEPLRTLARYRRRDGDVLFGQNAVHLGRGTLRVGEAVEVLERAEADPWGRPIPKGTPVPVSAPGA